MFFEQNLTQTASQTERCYLSIREQILSGELAPGLKIKINMLCKQHDVSLGAVREALARLSTEGLVKAEAQKGFQVSSISIQDLQYLAEARQEVESSCLEHAIAAGDLAWEANILACFHTLKMTPERSVTQPHSTSAEWEIAHQAFHHALVSACPNTWLLKIQDWLYVQNERYRRLSTHYDTQNRDTLQEHEQLMNALLKRDISAAKKEIKSHILTTSKIILEHMPE